MIKHFTKGTDEVLDFDFDFSTWLTKNGDSLNTSSANAVITISPSGSTNDLHLDNQVTQSGIVKVWLSKGRVGQQYSVVCIITTVGGRVFGEEHSWQISIQ